MAPSRAERAGDQEELVPDTAEDTKIADEPRDEAALKRVLTAVEAIRDGDFRVRLRAEGDDVHARIARAVNDIAGRGSELEQEVRRVQRAVARDGRLGERLGTEDLPGGWGGAAEGDFSQRVPTGGSEASEHPLRGETLRSAKTVNLLAERVEELTSEVARVMVDLGVEGRLGGVLRLTRASGGYADVAQAVNEM